MTKPDMPDRTYEVYEEDGKFHSLRRPAGGIHTYDGSPVHERTLRTWFVGEDGMTSVERENARLKEKVERQADALREMQAPIKPAAVDRLLEWHASQGPCHCENVGTTCEVRRAARHYKRLIESEGTHAELRARVERLEAGLLKLRDYDFIITPADCTLAAKFGQGTRKEQAND